MHNELIPDSRMINVIHRLDTISEINQSKRMAKKRNKNAPTPLNEGLFRFGILMGSVIVVVVAALYIPYLFQTARHKVYNL